MLNSKTYNNFNKMAITHQQIIDLRYICIAVIVVFVLNTVMLIHNLYRYIYEQRIYALLIVLFYLFAFLSFAFRIAELTTIANWTVFFPIHPFATVNAAISTSCFIYIGLTLILSMKQLAITIETITLQI